MNTSDIYRIRTNLTKQFPRITAKDAFPKTEHIQFRHIQPNLAPLEDIYSKGKN